MKQNILSQIYIPGRLVSYLMILKIELNALYFLISVPSATPSATQSMLSMIIRFLSIFLYCTCCPNMCCSIFNVCFRRTFRYIFLLIFQPCPFFPLSFFIPPAVPYVLLSRSIHSLSRCLI